MEDIKVAKQKVVNNSKVIRIECEGKTKLTIDKLTYFQDDLKVLSDENYEKLKANFIENGFSEPISVWEDNEKFYILNGHQRYTTLTRMLNKEQYSIEGDEIPVSIVKASSLERAKKKVLALTSEYGVITQESMSAFIRDAKIDSEYLKNIVNIPSINMDDITSNLKMDVNEIIGANNDSGNIDLQDDGGFQAVTDNMVDEQKKNDPMTGLRLVQVFLTDSELNDFKKKVDAIQDRLHLKNMTEVILKSVELTYENHKSAT